MTSRTFDTVLTGPDDGPAGCAVRLPFDAKAVFGKARMPVQVTIDEHPPFRTTIASYGGVGWIGLRKDQQAEFGVSVGDQVTVQVEADTAPRDVELPPELAAAFIDAPDAAAVYDALSFTHRKEYARWVAEAKLQQTRDSRAQKAVTMLRKGTRSPS